MQIHRHRTAIVRRRFSKPVQLLLDDGILNKEASFFDYGCGYGEDISFLKKAGITAHGFDPHFANAEKLIQSDVVNLGYILNIIENPKERKETLLRAHSLAEHLLVASVMIRDNSPAGENEKECCDGIITSWNTFQKYFKQAELKEYLESNLPGSSVQMASLGIAYIFKTDRFKQQYLSGRLGSYAKSISAELKEQEYREKISAWLSLYHELGRPPSKTEFPETSFIVRAFGSLEKAVQATRAELHAETVQASAERRKKSLVVALARVLIRNAGKAKMSDLSAEQHADVKLFFGNFSAALTATMQELQKLSSLENISSYINLSQVGKILPDDIYIHKDSILFAPDMLQILTELALIVLPSDIDWNIVKIARNGHHLSFLYYPDFENNPHPALSHSMKVMLTNQKLTWRDYGSSENPPILHRKETFLHSAHSLFEQFSALTQEEEEAGLLTPPVPGNREQWEKRVSESKFN